MQEYSPCGLTNKVVALMRFVDMQMYNSVHSEYSGDLKYLHTWLVVSLC